MINPFEYGGIVGEDSFCNRTKEQKELSRAIQNKENIFIYSERRVGKTSLIKLVLKKLPSQYLACYIDLWPTNDEAEFAKALAKSVSNSLASTTDKLLKTAKQFFSALRPAISLDDEGKPKLEFNIQKNLEIQELEELLEIPQKIALKEKKHVVIVFDEFQQILDYKTDQIVRTIRSIIQTHQNVSYVFLGSRKHLMRKLFLDKDQPLYRSGTHYPLEKIETSEWKPFIRDRFAKGKKKISDAMIKKMCDLTAGHPFYTQNICHVIWEICEERAEVTDAMINDGLKILLKRESYAYTSLWDSLTVTQRKVLEGLAKEASPIKVLSGEFIRKYKLGIPSVSQRASASLLEKGIIDREEGSYYILDKFFNIWVQREFG